MYIYAKIDENGFFVEDVVSKVELTADDLIETRPESGFFNPKWNGEKWIEGDTESVDKYKEEREKSNIEAVIYSKYPAEEQAQDHSYLAYGETTIIATSDTDITVDDVKKDIANNVIEFYGQTDKTADVFIEEYACGKQDDLQKHYAKLLKIGIKLQWAYLTIEEMKKAIEENREASILDYPFGEKNEAN